jgi:hypothetical protein
VVELDEVVVLLDEDVLVELEDDEVVLDELDEELVELDEEVLLELDDDEVVV